MREVDRIEKQLRCAVEGGAWHGPAVLELLSDVGAEQARARPIAGAHSIWELTAHITAWLRGGVQGIAGERIDYPPELDWPAVRDDGDEQWRISVEELRNTHAGLCAAIVRMKDARLDDVVAGKEYTVYVLLHGAIQHTLYHAGQIALLKRR